MDQHSERHYPNSDEQPPRLLMMKRKSLNPVKNSSQKDWDEVKEQELIRPSSDIMKNQLRDQIES